MPRASRICAEPGCPKVAGLDGRCQTHRRPAWVKRAGIPRTSAAWRRAVMARDDHTCRMCGQPASEADHIVNRATAPELALSVDNGQALCKPCHRAKTDAEKAAGRAAHR